MSQFSVTLSPEIIKLIPKRKGLRTEGDRAIFSDRHWTRKHAEHLLRLVADESQGGMVKAVKFGKIKKLSPSDAELQQIRDLLPDAGSLDGMAVFEISAANTRVDFERDQISRGVLDEMAAFVVNNRGISLLFDHNPKHIIGKVFDARVQLIPGQNEHFELIEKCYVLPEWKMPDQPDVTIIRAVETKILDKVSVRFSAAWEFQEDPEGGGVFVFVPSDTKEVMHPETSFVYFGGQRDAMRKSFEFKNKKKARIMDTFTKSFEVAGTDYRARIEVDTDQDTVILKMPEALQKDFNDMKTALEAEKAKSAALQKQLDAEKEPIITKILQVQDEDKEMDPSLKWDADQLKSWGVDRLNAHYRQIGGGREEKKNQIEKALKTEPTVTEKESEPEFF